MVFSSLIFLYAFLPLTFILYYIFPYRGYRNFILFAVSLVFYGWGEPKYILVMLASILSAYIFGFFIEKYRETDKRKARIFLTISLIINLSALLVFKYTNFFVENISKLIPALSGLKTNLVLPIGISFYTFQIMSYSIDVYRGDTKAQKNFIYFGAYVVLFPQLIAGPIVRYRDIEDMLTERHESIEKFASGVARFCAGLAKKVILADSAAAVVEHYRLANQFEPSVVGAWLVVLAYTFQIYFDFSGYSDMAIGLGRMFAFEFLENFNYPYISRSITEFWRRWHISLSTWFKEYVYIPLGGNRKGLPRQYLNIAIVWFLTGFWHGAAWNFILWGVYFGVILMLEKTFILKLLNKLPKVVGHIYSLILILFGWLIFSSSSISEIWAYTKMMLGIGAQFTTAAAAHDVVRLIPLFAVCVVASTPLMKNLYTRFMEKFKAASFLNPVLAGSSLLLCTAYMVDSTFSPFLYYIF